MYKIVQKRNSVKNVFNFFLIFVFVGSCFGGSKTVDKNGLRILFVYQSLEVGMHADNTHGTNAFKLRGSSVCKLNHIEQFHNFGVDVRVLVMGDETYAQSLQEKGMRVYTCKKPKSNSVLIQILTKKFADIIAQDPVDIIVCNEPVIAAAAKNLKNKNIGIVATLHTDPRAARCNYLRGVDGAACVGPCAEKLLKRFNKEQGLGLKVIEQVAPFFNVDRFLKFIPPTESKYDFFNREFGVTLKDGFIISSVANFYWYFKNHAVLIKATALLVHEYKLPVQLVLVGNGVRLEEMKTLAHKLKLDGYVHFVGLTQKVPEVNFYSDICALTSDSESFGIALAEAALMKKPLVATVGTGMEALVIDGQTGLLFEKNNEQALAAQLAVLIKNEQLRATLGANAYAHTVAHFLPEVGVSKLLNFYQKVLETKAEGVQKVGWVPVARVERKLQKTGHCGGAFCMREK